MSVVDVAYRHLSLQVCIRWRTGINRRKESEREKVKEIENHQKLVIQQNQAIFKIRL